MILTPLAKGPFWPTPNGRPRGACDSLIGMPKRPYQIKVHQSLQPESLTEKKKLKPVQQTVCCVHRAPHEKNKLCQGEKFSIRQASCPKLGQSVGYLCSTSNPIPDNASRPRYQESETQNPTSNFCHAPKAGFYHLRERVYKHAAFPSAPRKKKTTEKESQQQTHKVNIATRPLE